jgi:signal transduction histidine kinase/ActR/RegA family two-component response regulator
MDQTRGILAASEAENAKLRKALAVADQVHDTDQADMRANDVVANLAAAASEQEITRGRADLLESTIALALSRRQTDEGHADLVASELVNNSLSLANAMLVASEATLERLVEKRTAALTREIEERHRAEELLRQGEKLQAIGALTGGIAHDFNNILQVVVSGVDLLRQPGLAEEHRGPLLDKIDSAAESAAILISRLLTFARKQVLQPEVFDLNARLTRIQELLGPSLGPMIRWETNLASDLWPVIADPNQLEIAIVNLAVNARDAMLPQGGILTLGTSNVHLETGPERKAGDYVCLCVRDSGSGMSRAVKSRVFEPFFTTKAPGKGTGLGLPQVYGFAKQSGGEVTIESAPGEGTAIFLHLPRPKFNAFAPVRLMEGAEIRGRTPQAVERTILIVEDNYDLGSFTVSMLEEQGYATRRASNAKDALEQLDSGLHVDAVFSDVVMPGPMNGIQLADILRRQYPHLAVVLATGYSQALADGEQPVTAEVLSKPYRRHELNAALERAFSATRH